MELQVLGPIRMITGDQEIRPLTRQLRTLLAMLLIADGGAVSLDQIINAWWDEDPPASARVTVQAQVSRLRKHLNVAFGARASIRSSAAGYQLEVDPTHVDLHRFRTLASTAEQATSNAQAVNLLTESLSLWRGRALADLDGAWAEDTRAGLEGERLEAELRRVEAESRLGRHDDVLRHLDSIGESTRFNERAAAVRLRALHSLGRQDEALADYQGFARDLDNQLGIEPGPELSALHSTIVESRSSDRHSRVMTVESGAGMVVQAGSISGGVHLHTTPDAIPRQLPLSVAKFTGREAESRELLSLLHPDNSTHVTVLNGMPGVGKTALAVHAAHEAERRDWFRGGILYSNLHGTSRQPREAPEVLSAFVRALGTPSNAIPHQPDDLAALYRSLLSRRAERRVLIVLDDAGSADQVRPLLPSSPTCSVLVTSRRPLPELDFARSMQIDTLPGVDARALLEAGLPFRLTAEELDTIIELCAGLPLALRVVAAKLAHQPPHAVSDLIGSLTESQVLGGEDEAATLEAVFASSYERLEASAARLFRLLASTPGPDISVQAVAALIDLPEEIAAQQLDDLSKTSMVNATSTADRYAMHDLLRGYGIQRSLEQDSDDVRRAAMRRLLDHYLRQARNADLAFEPYRWRSSAEERDHAQRWVRSERANVLAAITMADENGFTDYPRDLARSLYWPFAAQHYWEDLVAVHQLALRATRRGADRVGQATVLGNLGNAYLELDRPEDAAEAYRDALTIHREIGDRPSEGTVLGNLGRAQHELGLFEQATTSHRRALDIHREIGDRLGEATVLTNLATTYRELGRLREATQLHQRALDVHREIGDRLGEATVLTNLATTYRESNRLDEAVRAFRRALSIYREVEDHSAEAGTLDDLGATLRLMGLEENASSTYRLALDVHRKTRRDLDAAMIDQVVAYLGTKRGRQSWRTVVNLAGRSASRDAALERALRYHDSRPAHRGALVELMSRLQDVADHDDEIAIGLDEWLDEASQAVPSATSTVVNVFSGTVTGTAMQGRDLTGPISFDVERES